MLAPGAAVRVANEKSEWGPNPELGPLIGLYEYFIIGLYVYSVNRAPPWSGGYLYQADTSASR